MAASLQRRARRGRGRRAGRIAEINVTPFVDVMLVLLIVFMVTAPLLTVGVPVELPKTEAKQLAADETPLTITVRADGQIYLQDTLVDDETLLPKLEALAREGLQSRIFIRGDSAANYGVVAQVMAKVSAAGYRNIGLVTDTLDREKKKG
jgi:biopolymer transport protein TolR